MAPVLNIFRTCIIIMHIFFYVYAVDNKLLEPRIISLKVESKICDDNNCKYLLTVKGGEFLGHYSWRLTHVLGSRGGSCDVIYPKYQLREVLTTQWYSKFEIILPYKNVRIYFCLYENSVRNSPFGGKWLHQGSEHFVDINEKSQLQNSNQTKENIQHTNASWSDLSRDIQINSLPNVPHLTREEANDIEILYNDNYVPLNQVQKSSDENSGANANSIERDKRHVAENSSSDNDDVSLENLTSIAYETTNFDDRRTKGNENSIESAIKTNKSDDAMTIAEDSEDKFRGYRKNERIHPLHNLRSNFDESDSRKPKIFEPNIDEFKSDRNANSLKFSLRNFREFTNVNDFDYIRTEHSGRNVFSIGRHKREAAENKSRDASVTDDSIQHFRHVSNDNHDRKSRQSIPEADFTSVRAFASMVSIEGVRVEDSEKEPNIVDEAVPSVLADSKVTLRLFGDGLSYRTVIAFTHEEQPYGQPCKFLLKGEYKVKEGSLKPRTALFDVIAPSPISISKVYICAKNLKIGITDPSKDEEKYLHQGTETYKMIATHNSLLPLWFSITLILTCLTFSALFSGLNLGLMSLDRTELKIISNTGTEQERKYARAIMPVRDHGNYLLCSILLGNVAVNSTFTILLDELTSGLFAVIFSTLAIVLLGEITPQAICSRHGLMVGAKSIMVTKAVMALTAPLAFPVSKLLDYFLGEEIGSVYNRERLKELVKVTTDVNDLDRDEVNIISGALELRKKTVEDVMTKLEDVFMLPISSVLDFETMSEIVKSGYSRIPVYEGHRGNIITVLFIKDLAFVDPDDNTPLRTLCQYYQNPCNFVFEDVTLDIMFKQFKEGHKGHMAFVHRINNEGEGDPFYETIGLVTLEDVIEEMIQAEIVDETDVFMDNRTKRRRNRPQNKLQDFAAFAERHENQRIHISPQLTLATFQFLSTSVDAFRPDTVSETVLRRLLRQDVIHYIKLKGKTKKDPTTYVFQQGKPVDYFVLILEGRVEVTVGRENLVFEAGPFTYFGSQALTQNVGVAESPTPSAMGSLQNINMDSMLRHTFVPDYSVRAITELYYLTVKRSLYLAAKRATLMEKGALSKGATNEQFDTEVDKHLCNSSSANIPISLISKKLLGKSTSTASTRNTDDFGSTSAGNKLQPRFNIIELTQMRNYASSDPLDKPLTKRCSNSDTRPRANQTKSYHEMTKTGPSRSLANACDSAKYWANYEMNGRCDTSKRLANDTDPNDCAVCVRNNFWMNRCVLNKSIDDSKESDHYKKKKTTFHTDSSLLTIHNLSPPVQDTADSKTHEIDYESTADDIDFRYDRLEFERENVDYEKEWREERLSVEKTRLETEQMMLVQLSKIIKMLEGNQLLEAVDEDISISGEHKTPSRQVSPNPLPISASPHPRPSVVSRASPEPRVPEYGAARADEQEKLLK